MIIFALLSTGCLDRRDSTQADIDLQDRDLKGALQQIVEANKGSEGTGSESTPGETAETGEVPEVNFPGSEHDAKLRLADAGIVIKEVKALEGEAGVEVTFERENGEIRDVLRYISQDPETREIYRQRVHGTVVSPLSEKGQQIASLYRTIFEEEENPSTSSGTAAQAIADLKALIHAGGIPVARQGGPEVSITETIATHKVGGYETVFSVDKAVETEEEGSNEEGPMTGSSSVTIGTAETRSGTGGGTTPIPEWGPAGIDVTGEGTTHLIRYACCNGLKVRESFTTSSSVVEEVAAGTLLWMTDVFPSGAVKNVLEAVDGSGNLSDALYGSTSAFFARVFNPKTNKSGYVPIYQLFVSPPQKKPDKLQVEMGYGILTRYMNHYFTEFAQGKPQAVQFEICAEGQSSAIYNKHDGSLELCTVGNPTFFCDLCSKQAEGELPSQKEICMEEAELFGDTPAVKECQNAAGWPDEDGNIEEYNCDSYLHQGECKWYDNLMNYAPGEYPVGYTYPHSPNSKVLMFFDLWDEIVAVKMDRDQISSAIQVDNLTNPKGSPLEEFQIPAGLDTVGLWLSVEPGLHDHYESALENPVLKMDQEVLFAEVCFAGPGTEMWASNTEFDASKTSGDAFKKIKWGRYRIDQVSICMLGSIYMDGQWRPGVQWVDVTRLDLKGFQVVDAPKVVFAWWVYVTVVVASVILWYLVPVLGAIIAAILIAATALLYVAPPIIAQGGNDEWLIEEVMKFVPESKIFDAITKELNKTTTKSLDGAIPGIKQQVTNACAAAFPAGQPSIHSPFRYLYDQCQDFMADPKLNPFQEVASSADAGCYTLMEMRYFSPVGKVDPKSSPGWYGYSGQDWDSNAGNDKGCRVGFVLETVTEKNLWPTLKCFTAQGNLWANQFVANQIPDAGDFATLGANISTNCYTQGRNLLLNYYGTGEDVADLYFTKHPLGGPEK